jgi:uncharacterized protein (DUF2236 family)
VRSNEAAEAIESVRLAAQRAVRGWLTGSSEPPVRLVPTADGDEGLFGPASVAWRVHADASMFIGGLRALLYQTAHPPTMAGVADHSDYKNDPLGRLQRTAGYIGITTFGPTDEARRMIELVRTIHDRVVGTTPEGIAYRANDPHLLGWVHATEVDSFLRAFQRYGAKRLTPVEADQYVAEMAVVARLIGVVDPPTDQAELVETLGRYIPELGANSQARDAVRFLLWPPLHPASRLPYGIVAAASIEMLPAVVRRTLQLPILPLAEPFLVRPATTALVRGLAWTLAP